MGELLRKAKLLPTVMLLGLIACNGKPTEAQIPPAPTLSPTPHAANGVVAAGYDISYPQCGKDEGQLPHEAKRVVVGLSGTLANNFNDCFPQQVAWAQKISVKGIDIYVNTANPGPVVEGAKIADWPMSGNNTYGMCKGDNTAACAYEYGWERAEADVRHLSATGVDLSGGTVYLDVEADRSWGDTANNRAALEGMTKRFQEAGYKVGAYAIPSQWKELVGEVPATSNLHDMPTWVAGAQTLEEAQNTCQRQLSFTAGRVALAQVAGDFIDQDVIC